MNANSRLEDILRKLKVESAFSDQYSPPKHLTERMSELQNPGVSLAIIDDFELVSVDAFGVSDTRTQNKLTNDSLFLAGSISKSVFATGVMLLVQQGKLDLDEDINKYLTSWKIPANQGWQPRVTLRNILSHTAGLTVHGFPGYLTTEKIPTTVQVLNGEPPANTPAVVVNQLPGVEFRYSGGGTTVGQLAVCDHLNELSFATLMNRLVLQPLNMDSSTFENPLPKSRVAQASVAHPSNGVPLEGNYPVYPEMAAAGLWSTPKDLANFGIDLLKSLRGSTDQLLQQSTLQDMLKPQLRHQGESKEYAGLGFFCERDGEDICFYHGGWDEGFVCSIRLHHPTGKGAVVMINSNAGHLLIDEIFQAIAEEYDWPLRPSKTHFVEIPNYEQFVGEYVSESGLTATIIPIDKGITLQFESQAPVLFYPTSETTFTSEVINTELEFSRDDDGNIFQMDAKLENVTARMTRKSR